MVGKTSFHFKSWKSFSGKPTGMIKRRPEVLDQMSASSTETTRRSTVYLLQTEIMNIQQVSRSSKSEITCSFKDFISLLACLRGLKRFPILYAPKVTGDFGVRASSLLPGIGVPSTQTGVHQQHPCSSQTSQSQSTPSAVQTAMKQHKIFSVQHKVVNSTWHKIFIVGICKKSKGKTRARCIKLEVLHLQALVLLLQQICLGSDHDKNGPFLLFSNCLSVALGLHQETQEHVYTKFTDQAAPCPEYSTIQSSGFTEVKEATLHVDHNNEKRTTDSLLLKASASDSLMQDSADEIQKALMQDSADETQKALTLQHITGEQRLNIPVMHKMDAAASYCLVKSNNELRRCQKDLMVRDQQRHEDKNNRGRDDVGFVADNQANFRARRCEEEVAAEG
ncbi:hypothetical protein Anapl_05395 [Anas platyrhynchos]|uniref:Uncharacterized protein n=1 Tax=Anas platyrhynchos TaxID=8839 RepID=R0L739_ANAPL|nr:hypothetical protein Anapl_05395 [Anas platyrhynchos]